MKCNIQARNGGLRPALAFLNLLTTVLLLLPASLPANGMQAHPDMKLDIRKEYPCKSREVTVAEWCLFVEATGYVTDAEVLGWSVVTLNNLESEKVAGATWRQPTGKTGEFANDEMPVTQVSYNDVQAYCDWANVRLYSLDEWWQEAGQRTEAANIGTHELHPADGAEMIGNVWEWTAGGYVTGGSMNCDRRCKGWQKENSYKADSPADASNVLGFRVKNKE